MTSRVRVFDRVEYFLPCILPLVLVIGPGIKDSGSKTRIKMSCGPGLKDNFQSWLVASIGTKAPRRPLAFEPALKASLVPSSMVVGTNMHD